MRMPPESAFGWWLSKPSRPTSRIASVASRIRSAGAAPSSSASNSTFCRTVRHGSSVASWKTEPMFSTSRATSPDVAGPRPDAMRSSVDLPQPDGPTIDRNSPAPSVNEMSRTASVPSGNTLPAARNAITSPAVIVQRAA